MQLYKDKFNIPRSSNCSNSSNNSSSSNISNQADINCANIRTASEDVPDLRGQKFENLQIFFGKKAEPQKNLCQPGSYCYHISKAATSFGLTK